MKSPDRITGTLTRCIGHEKRLEGRLAVLAIIATVIPSVASIVTRHVVETSFQIMASLWDSRVFPSFAGKLSRLRWLGERKTLLPANRAARKNAAQEHIRLPCGVR
ncbi:hypothetical protein FHS76_003302 [Ochrobactrum daejeonense]|uniref:Uncharacterized protein n=1 Tax=Brucella daejeonensis TaxID=659015 RepID=A0A7W9B076_9HYPH|nr:hypothetical protein [Brucella daejeonensis]MBB5703399.1 hypothetical protein [Brucella daejeonensis]